jgi:hypothetical protein
MQEDEGGEKIVSEMLLSDVSGGPDMLRELISIGARASVENLDCRRAGWARDL